MRASVSPLTWVAVDENFGAHRSACGSCAGLVHTKNAGAGQVEYTTEYYTIFRHGRVLYTTLATNAAVTFKWRDDGK